MAAVAVAVVLLAVSVAAGLRLPSVQHLRGYPAAAHLESDRPPAGFVPLTQRFIARVLGLPTGTRGDTPATHAAARPGRPLADGRGVASPRVTVSHPFSNDTFDDAYVIPAVPFTARTTTGSATREPGESTACAPVGGTAWYRYTAVADERLLALTLGSDYALALGVFTGDRVNGVQSIGCNNGPTGNAQVGFRATKGESYYFQVTGVAGGGNLVFSLDPVGRTQRVSVSSSGEQADHSSIRASLSSEGRYVVFDSEASNLTPDQPRCSQAQQAAVVACPTQLFMHDRTTGSTFLVSVSSTGEPAAGDSFGGSLSRDGRYVAFTSSAANLPHRGGNQDRLWQVYVHDRATRLTERISVAASGDERGGGGLYSSISDDGRYVVFTSRQRDLTPTPPPCAPPFCPDQVYVRDRLTRTTTLVSQAYGGGFGNGSSAPESHLTSVWPSISADGGTVAFSSEANNLVRGDTNDRADVFVRDLRAGRTERVSIGYNGAQGNAPSAGSTGVARYVSGDGRYVAFESHADNLVRGDTNRISDFFVRDRVLGTTTRVSVSSTGAQGEPPPWVTESTSGGVAISDDGRYVAFDSGFPNLADDAPASPLDVYVRDLVQGKTTRGSVSSLGDPGDYHSFHPALSGRGEVVAFWSSASNLVPDDTNRGCISPRNTRDNCSDVFVHELPAAP